MDENYDEKRVLELYMTNDLFGGTDGSVNEARCAFSWGLKQYSTETLIVKSHGPIANAPEDANSTRAEMFAVICAISYMGYICDKHGYGT